MDKLRGQRTTALVAACACVAAVLAGVLVARPGSDGPREDRPVIVRSTQAATPAATPVDLPPFFGGMADPDATAHRVAAYFGPE
jgi:hypothetical protein